jgi:hypothetical protein
VNEVIRAAAELRDFCDANLRLRQNATSVRQPFIALIVRVRDDSPRQPVDNASHGRASGSRPLVKVESASRD